MKWVGVILSVLLHNLIFLYLLCKVLYKVPSPQPECFEVSTFIMLNLFSKPTIMNKKTIKRIGLIILAVIIIAGGIGAYAWFKPHRNVQATKAFAELKVNDLVNEFSADAATANRKYLASDGNSKVLTVEGRVSKISVNQNGETVIVLKDHGARAGVIATLLKETSDKIAGIKEGDVIQVKGVITAGSSYDADLDLYEHAVLVQSDIVK
jgi:hypothetical protein